MSKAALPFVCSTLSLALAATAIGLTGCGPGSRTAAPTSAEHEAEKAKPNDIKLDVVDRARYEALLAERRGKVVLVDFWAGWCGPCLAQLPHTVELAHKHGGQLAVMTVSMDDPESPAGIKKKLHERGATDTLNLVSRETGPQGMEAFEIDGGSLPHYKVYDRKGKLRQTFGVDPSAEKQFTSEDVAAAVESLINE